MRTNVLWTYKNQKRFFDCKQVNKVWIIHPNGIWNDGRRSPHAYAWRYPPPLILASFEHPFTEASTLNLNYVSPGWHTLLFLSFFWWSFSFFLIVFFPFFIQLLFFTLGKYFSIKNHIIFLYPIDHKMTKKATLHTLSCLTKSQWCPTPSRNKLSPLRLSKWAFTNCTIMTRFSKFQSM